MSFYAVGYGTWSCKYGRDPNAEEIKKWEDEHPGKSIPDNYKIITSIVDGSSAKVDGPFPTIHKAWKKACELQEGASMMASFPFVFKFKNRLKKKTLLRKVESIDCCGAEMIVLDEYADYEKKKTSGGLHIVRIIKPYDIDKDHKRWFNGNWRIDVPTSLNARRRLRNKLKKETVKCI